MAKDLIQWFIIIVFFILIVFFIRQNIHLKTSKTSKSKYSPEKLKAISFEYKLKEYFLFKEFPLKLKMANFNFYEEHKKDYFNGYIIMVFDLTVCGKCLHEQLSIIKTFRDKAEQINIVFLAIIGLSDKNEESEVINLHRSGEIFFPCKMLSIESLYRTFKLDKENFLDTPFFIYANHTFKILDIFKPPYLDKKEFYRWLIIITNQEFF